MIRFVVVKPNVQTSNCNPLISNKAIQKHNQLQKQAKVSSAALSMSKKQQNNTNTKDRNNKTKKCKKSQNVYAHVKDVLQKRFSLFDVKFCLELMNMSVEQCIKSNDKVLEKLDKGLNKISNLVSKYEKSAQRTKTANNKASTPKKGFQATKK